MWGQPTRCVKKIFSRLLREATPYDEKPTYLMCDHDQKFGADFERVADTAGIDLIQTPSEAPLANALCERFVSSVRRECLDQVLVLGVRQWVRILTDDIRYFTHARPHQGIAQQLRAATPSPPGAAQRGKVIAFPQTEPVIAFPALHGLHHDDGWVAEGRSCGIYLADERCSQHSRLG